MEFVQTLDNYGKPAWITLMVLGFIVFWPIGLGVLAYLIWSGRMGCKSQHRGSGSQYWKGFDAKRWHQARESFRSTGNTAFDEYREETLKRLEDEADEFKAFLERLRDARDRAEFDQFMAEGKDGSRGGDKPEAGDSPVPQTP